MYRNKYLKSLIFFLTLFFNIAFAAEEMPAVSRGTWNYLNQAYTALDHNDYNTALKALAKADENAPNNQYEQALIWRTQGAVFSLAGQQKKAGNALFKALDSHALPINMAVQTAMELAVNLVSRKQYNKAVTLLTHWLKESPDPPANLHMLLAQVYAEQNQYQKALSPMKAAFKKNPVPPDGWHQLAVAIHYELKKYAHCVPYLNTLISRHPNNNHYWQQLVSIHQLDNRPDRSIAVLEAAKSRKLLQSEEDSLRLASLYLELDMPINSARLLTKELEQKRISGNSEHWALLAHSWREARELKKASVAMEKAARRSSDGRLWLQLAYLYQEQENWPACKRVLKAALKKGKLAEPGQAHLLLGTVLAQLDENVIALKEFNKAKNYKKTRKPANQWIGLLQYQGDHP